MSQRGFMKPIKKRSWLEKGLAGHHRGKNSQTGRSGIDPFRTVTDDERGRHVAPKRTLREFEAAPLKHFQELDFA